MGALEEGIVPGGGTTFVALSKLVPDIARGIEDAEERLGADIVQKALLAPTTVIANNAGVEGDVVVSKVASQDDFRVGYNAMDDRYEDLMKAGIIDPKMVIRASLQNSCSMAGMVLTTQ